MRTLLMIVLLGSLAAPAAAETFAIARLKYDGGGDWYSDPTSLPRLLEGLRERTTVLASEEEFVVSLDDTELYRYPMLYATGHGNIRFNDRQLATLRRYLTNGGFLWVDDNYGMDESFRREMQRLFPENSLVEVPFDHPIYRIHYDFPQGLPKVHKHDGGPPKGLGVFLDGRMVVFYSQNTDIGDGLEHPSVHNNPPEVREQALRMAINIVLFALTQG